MLPLEAVQVFSLVLPIICYYIHVMQEIIKNGAEKFMESKDPILSLPGDRRGEGVAEGSRGSFIEGGSFKIGGYALRSGGA